MSEIHSSFHRPPPAGWLPIAGERVRLLYQDQTFEGVIRQLLDARESYVIVSDDLLLPVVCGRNSIRPFGPSSNGEKH